MIYLNMAIASFVGVVVGAFTSWLLSAPKRKKKEKEELNHRLDKIEEGTKCLLRSEIQRQYLAMCKAGREWVRPYEKSNLSYLYAAYRALGGNSYITKLYEIAMEMPVKED
ncbi:hypothetical protein ACQRB4_06175 [Peptoniphilaceae bacterium SGI.097]